MPKPKAVKAHSHYPKVNSVKSNSELMLKAIALSEQGMRAGKGGPFGAVVAKGGESIGQGSNRVLETNDPTAHAEIVAIREAALALGNFKLTGCVLFTSCEPCPMCLAAAYWAGIEKIVYANSRKDAAKIGFGDDLIYQEISLPLTKRKIPISRLLAKQANRVFKDWMRNEKRVHYGPTLTLSSAKPATAKANPSNSVVSVPRSKRGQ